MESEITLSELLGLLRKNLLMILSIIVVFVLIAYFITAFVMKPVYKAQTQVLVNQKQDSQKTINVGEVQSDIQLVNTYRVIIKSNRILSKVQSENPIYSLEQLNEAIEVNNDTNSQVINISVKDTNSKDAVKVANDTAQIFENEIGNIMNIENAKVLSKADEKQAKDPISPKLILNLLIAAILGFLFSIFIIFLRNALDKTVTTDKDVEEIFNVPNLGNIRKFSNKEILKMQDK